tara:strand:+ start:790 stop:933 length:144 start_codon:yes stop_codon:yes gene_type:complete
MDVFILLIQKSVIGSIIMGKVIVSLFLMILKIKDANIDRASNIKEMK